MNNHIFILSYANTHSKIEILKECVNSVKNIGLPVVSISNLLMESSILDLFDNFKTGQNQQCCFEDYFTDLEIDFARISSKYLLYFTTPDGDQIYYRQLSYGRGCTYHWSTLSQFKLILDYCKDKNIDYFFSLEGDCVIDESDTGRVKEYFELMSKENLDFLVSLGPMFDFMSGNACFFKTSYLEKCFEGTSCEDFLKSTYPSFSAESYLFNRLIQNGGKSKLFLFDSDLRNEFPENCSIERKIIDNLGENFEPIKLLYPNTKKMHLSISTDRLDQSPLEPLKYVDIGLGTKNGQDVIFIWNQYNGQTVSEVHISIKIMNDIDVIFQSNYRLSPGVWSWDPIFNLNSKSHCEIKLKIIDITKKEFITSYRFEHIKN